MLSAVIFDLDGTLIDSKDVMRRAYMTAHAEVFGSTRAAPPFSEYCKYLGCSFPEIMRRLGLPAEPMYEVFARESTRLIGDIRMFDGVSEMLGHLYGSGVPMAIATGKFEKRTRQILDHLGISRYFAVVIGSDMVSRPKPAPDMALMIAERMHLDPSKTLFVGDAVADIECGNAAGMVSALAAWDAPTEVVRQQPVKFVFDLPCEIPALLGVNVDADLAAG